jgi:hypothetical protein
MIIELKKMCARKFSIVNAAHKVNDTYTLECFGHYKTIFFMLQSSL